METMVYKDVKKSSFKDEYAGICFHFSSLFNLRRFRSGITDYINEEELIKIESIDNCFPVIDYRVYLPIEEGVIPQQEAKLKPLYT